MRLARRGGGGGRGAVAVSPAIFVVTGLLVKDAARTVDPTQRLMRSCCPKYRLGMRIAHHAMSNKAGVVHALVHGHVLSTIEMGEVRQYRGETSPRIIHQVINSSLSPCSRRQLLQVLRSLPPLAGTDWQGRASASCWKGKAVSRQDSETYGEEHSSPTRRRLSSAD